VVGTAVFNFALNGLIAWGMVRGVQSVPLWGHMSVGNDTIGTAFVLPLLTTLIVSRIVARGYAAKRVSPLTFSRDTYPVLATLPATGLARGAALGLVCVLAIGLPTALALGAIGIVAMEAGHFVAFKAAFAAALAALVQPVIALAALADAGKR
jgi:hypothetical protein